MLLNHASSKVPEGRDEGGSTAPYTFLSFKLFTTRHACAKHRLYVFYCIVHVNSLNFLQRGIVGSMLSLQPSFESTSSWGDR